MLQRLCPNRTESSPNALLSFSRQHVTALGTRGPTCAGAGIVTITAIVAGHVWANLALLVLSVLMSEQAVWSQHSVMRSCHLENLNRRNATASNARPRLPAKTEEPCKHSTPQLKPMMRSLGAPRALQGSQLALQTTQHMDVYLRSHKAEVCGHYLF